MKKRTKFTIAGLTLLAGALLLTGCTASFCSNNDKAHILYAFDFGVTEYYAADDADKPADAVLLYEGNTNIYYTVNVPTASGSGIGKTNAEAKKAGLSTPTDNYFIKMDQLVLEQSLAELNPSYSTATLKYDDILEALDKFGYTKFAGEKLWDNWYALNDQLKILSQDTTSGVNLDDLPNEDWIKIYKKDMNSLIAGYRSCIAIDEDNYGNYGYNNEVKYRRDIAVKYHGLTEEEYRGKMSTTIEGKTWKGAWNVNGKFTFFEGLLVYPISWLTETFVKGFKNGGVVPGLAQLLAIFVITFIVRSLMLLVTIKQTTSNAKMTALQPEITKIQNKYPNSNTNNYQKQQMAQEMNALYKKHKINPLGAFLVMIVQFPVFICVWGALQGSASLSSDTFLNLHLSDSINNVLFNGSNWTATGGFSAFTALVLFLLMAGAQVVSMLIPQWIQKKKRKQVASLGKNPAQNDQQSKMKMFTYVMMAMIIFMGFTLPSAMGVYWFVGALFSICQTLIIEAINNRKSKKKGH